MLEQLLIFTRGGLILWTCKEIGNALKGSPIDTLIRSCLLEERSGAVSFNYDAPGAAYTLKWTFHNDLGLVFVAVYQRILNLLYVDDLLAMVKQSFSEIYDPKKMTYDDFDETFRQLRKEAEARAEELRKTKQAGKPVNMGKKQGQVSKAGVEGGNRRTSENGSKTDDGDGNKAKDNNLANGHSNGNHEIEDSQKTDLANGKENTTSNIAVDVSKLEKLRSKGVRGRGGRKTDTVVNKSSKVATEPVKKATKKARVWGDAPPKEEKLDFTDPINENGNNGHVDIVAADQGESMMDKEETFSSDNESDDDDDEPGSDEKPEAKRKGWFSSVFQRLASFLVRFATY